MNHGPLIFLAAFFALAGSWSGFVLAPQIGWQVVGGPWRNLGVFLVRRWMRTIPPYVAALVAIALLWRPWVRAALGAERRPRVVLNSDPYYRD